MKTLLLLFLISIVSIIFVIIYSTSVFAEKSIEISQNNLMEDTNLTYDIETKVELDNKIFNTHSGIIPILNIIGHNSQFLVDPIELIVKDPQIVINDYSSSFPFYLLDPQELTIKKGEKILIKNNSSGVMALGNGDPESGVFDPYIFYTDIIDLGDSTVIETSNIGPGVYPYFCQLHPFVTGTIIIQ